MATKKTVKKKTSKPARASAKKAKETSARKAAARVEKKVGRAKRSMKPQLDKHSELLNPKSGPVAATPAKPPEEVAKVEPALNPTVPTTTDDKLCTSRYPKTSTRCEGRRFHKDDHFAHKDPKKDGATPVLITWKNDDKKQKPEVIERRDVPTSALGANAKCAACLQPIARHKPDCSVVNARTSTSDSSAPTKEMIEARKKAKVYRHNEIAPAPATSIMYASLALALERYAERDASTGAVRQMVKFIPLNDSHFQVHRLQAAGFDHHWKEIVGYPAERCARLYAGYSQHLGATHEAMDEFAKLVPVTQHQKENAMAKKPSIAVASKKPGVKTKLDTKPAEKKAPKEKAERKESAADAFRALIKVAHKEKITDREIAERVAKKFGGEVKYNYPAWYRNQMKKANENPPAAYVEKVPAKAEKKSKKAA